jgi:hypothetical protein
MFSAAEWESQWLVHTHHIYFVATSTHCATRIHCWGKPAVAREQTIEHKRWVLQMAT